MKIREFELSFAKQRLAKNRRGTSIDVGGILPFPHKRFGKVLIFVGI
jgi:hypothetical protein